MAKEELTVLGMPVVKTEKGDYQVTKKNFEKYLDSKGITKEVRDLTTATEQELIAAGVEFVSARNQELIKENPKANPTELSTTLFFGTGDGKRTITQEVAKDVSTRKPGEPATGETVRKYGIVTYKRACKIPTVLTADDGVIATEANHTKEALGIND